MSSFRKSLGALGSAPRRKLPPVSAAAALLALTLCAPPPAGAQNRQPFQRDFAFDLGDGLSGRNFFTRLYLGGEELTRSDPYCNCTYIYDKIPAGKRVVIEFVTATAKLPSGQMIELDISTYVRWTKADGAVQEELVSHAFVPVNKVSGAKDWYVLSEATKIYASGGTAIFLIATRSAATGVANVRVNISGYFEDAP
jgi:hypothetical protein